MTKDEGNEADACLPVGGGVFQQPVRNKSCRITVGLTDEVEKQGLNLGRAAFPRTSMTSLSPLNPL